MKKRTKQMSQVKQTSLKNHYFLLGLILLLSFFMRFYHIKLAGFNFDHERDAWAIREMVINQKPTLIGPDIRRGRVKFFLGPYHYYFLLPSYLLANLDPIGSLIFGAGLGVGTTFLFYFVANKLFDQRTGLLAAFFHAASFTFSEFDRSPLNSYSNIYLSLLFIFTFSRVLKDIEKNSIYLFLTAFIFGLMLQAHLVNIFLAPAFLLLIPSWLSLKKDKGKVLLLTSFAFLLTCLPLIIFDLRHNFLNFRLFFSSANSRLSEFKPWQNVLVVYRVFCEGVGSLFFEKARFFLLWVEILIFFSLILVLGKISFSKKRQRRDRVLTFLICLLFFPLFGFTLFSGDIVETVQKGELQPYYFSAIWGAYILLLSSLISRSLRFSWGKIGVGVGLIVFVILNLPSRVYYRNPYGYIYKKKVIDFVLKDSEKKSLEDFKISFVTVGGFDTGYRYLFVLKGGDKEAFTNIDGSSFVYTIVVPSDYENIKSDYIFGNIGLIMPKKEKERD